MLITPPNAVLFHVFSLSTERVTKLERGVLMFYEFWTEITYGSIEFQILSRDLHLEISLITFG
jgi:hypothetical protein